MHLMFNNEQTVADWASKKWGKPIPPWYFAVGILNNRLELQGTATFHNYNGSNIELFYIGKFTFSKGVLTGLADYIFNHLKVERLTVSVPRYNKALLRSLPKLGFRVEGVLRHFYGPYKKDDAIVFGILASEGKKYVSKSS